MHVPNFNVIFGFVKTPYPMHWVDFFTVRPGHMYPIPLNLGDKRRKKDFVVGLVEEVFVMFLAVWGFCLSVLGFVGRRC